MSAGHHRQPEIFNHPRRLPCHANCGREIKKGDWWIKSGLNSYHVECFKQSDGSPIFEPPVKPARLEVRA